MGKKSKAPDYATTTTDTNLYGSSTTGKTGTTFNPTNFQTGLVGAVEQNVPAVFNEYLNPSYSSELYQAQKAQRQKEQAQAYDSSVLSQLANRGLMRSSGLQAATNAFADTLADQEAQALNDYQTQQANKLSTLMNLYTVPYNMVQGINNASQNLSNAVSNYNYRQWQANNSGSGALQGGLSGAVNGAMAGASTGNPWAALGGAVIGGAAGALSNR